MSKNVCGGTRLANFRKEVSRYQDMLEDAVYRLDILRAEREKVGLDQIQKFLDLTSEINTQVIRKDTAEKQIEYIKSMYNVHA